jgi:hypothetical protein
MDEEVDYPGGKVMNKERLKRLANYLDTVKPEEFNLKDWKCGTVACAVGHACSIPEFSAAGLKLEFVHGINRWTPILGDDESWEAVKLFFGIDDADARWLFCMHDYESGYETTAAQVSARIREFVS